MTEIMRLYCMCKLFTVGSLHYCVCAVYLGAPLAVADLVAETNLRDRISAWLLSRASGGSGHLSGAEVAVDTLPAGKRKPGGGRSLSAIAADGKSVEDDLYDF